MSDPFYLTLPSNSSLQYFPNNTLTRYITKLPRHIELQGKWEVALVEIIFPVSFYNVKNASFSVYTNYDEKTEVLIPSGHYNSIEHLLGFINDCRPLSGHVKFQYDSVTGRVHQKNDGEFSVEFDEQLRRLLGYDSENSIEETNQQAYIDRDIPRELFVYSDIAEPQLVGDTTAPLLRIVGIDNNQYGATVVKTYDSPHYVPVLKRHFEVIETDIRLATSQVVPFQFGTLTIKLHFRPWHPSLRY